MMDNKDTSRAQTVAFTGHRLISSADRPRVKDRLMEAILRAYEDGYRVFISGMACGFDLMAAECVVELKSERPDITMMAAIPYRGQCERWRKASQLKYWAPLHKADEQIVLSPDYRPDCFLRRDRYMVEHASRLIAYFNGIPKGGTFYTVNEAKRQGVMVENIY